MVKYKESNILDIEEAFELKWLFVPRAIIDDGGKRARYKEVIRFLYMNGYKIVREKQYA